MPVPVSSIGMRWKEPYSESGNISQSAGNSAISWVLRTPDTKIYVKFWNFCNRFCVLTISEFFFNGFFVVTISEVFLMDFICRADFAINMAFYKKIKISRAYSLYRVFTFCNYIEYCWSRDKMPKFFIIR